MFFELGSIVDIFFLLLECFTGSIFLYQPPGLKNLHSPFMLSRSEETYITRRNLKFVSEKRHKCTLT
jgi:hypothetical protein